MALFTWVCVALLLTLSPRLLLTPPPSPPPSAPEDEGFEDVQGWRISCLFLLFVVLAFLFEHGVRYAERSLRKRKFRALRHAFLHLQEEIFLLGFLSLVLVAAEPALGKICIPAKPPPRNSPAFFNILLHKEEEGKEGNPCKPGFEPFWSKKLISQTHVFLFVLGVSYTVYTCATLALCLLKVRTWHGYEKEVAKEPQRRWPLKAKLSGRDLRFWSFNWLRLFTKSFFGQFSESVNEGTYSAIRWHFLVKHSLPWEFDFLHYVTESMEEDIGKVLSTEWLLLLLSAAVLTIVTSAERFFFLTLLSAVMLLLVLVAGAKLEAVAGTLAQMSADYQDAKRGEQYEVAPGGQVHTRPETPAPDYQISEGRSQPISSDLLKDEVVIHKLFWFGRPGLLLRLFQLVFFVNSLSISIVLHSAWQFPSLMTSDTRGVVTLVATLVLNFVVVTLAAWYILPEYALVSVCGSAFNPKRVKRASADRLG